MFYNKSTTNQILSYIAIFNHHFTGAVWWNKYLDILKTIQNSNFFPLLLTHQYYFWHRWFFFCRSNIWPTNVINFSSRLFINMNIDGIIGLVNQLMNTNFAYWTLYFFILAEIECFPLFITDYHGNEMWYERIETALTT